jgi:hypothetical protein
LPDLHADRSLRDVHPHGGGGERARLGNRGERPQLSNLHQFLYIRVSYRPDKIF